MNCALLISLAALGAISAVQAFSHGAPEGVCGDMTPKHPDTPQTDESPYKIVLKKKSVAPGASISVVVSSPPGQTFKGFMVQARVGDKPVGQFLKSPKSYKLLNCLGGTSNSATHIDAKPKNRVTFNWVAPEDLSESVVFVATVAKDGAVFWVQQKSEAVTVG